MEKTTINIKYIDVLSDSESELLTQLKGEWLSREADLVVDLRVLFNDTEAANDTFTIQSMNTNEHEVALASTTDEQIIILIALKDPYHLRYQVTNQDRMGTSPSIVLAKG